MSNHILVSPLSVPVSKKKKFILNINNYRNTHYHVLNKAKVVYKDMMCDQIATLPEYDMVELIYTLYPGTKRLCDLSNICSIVDKFFADALVESNKIVDDNYIYLRRSTYRFGKVDKNYPRVEIEIVPVYHVGLDYFTGH